MVRVYLWSKEQKHHFCITKQCSGSTYLTKMTHPRIKDARMTKVAEQYKKQ